MKKIITLLWLGILSTLLPLNINAQSPGINLVYAGDSTWSIGCSVPDTSSFMIYGSAAGYPANDSVYLEVYFGDGSDTSFYTPIVQNNYFYDYGITHIYTLPGNYTVIFIATGSDGDDDTLSDNSVLISTSCGNISGTVYLDSNNDCMINSGETFLQHIFVEAEHAGTIFGTYTDSLGNYYLSVPAGFTYDVSIIYPGTNVNCPASGVHTVSTFPASGTDFGVSCSSQHDLTGGVFGQGFRVSNNTGFSISAINQMLSCVPPNSIITVTLDPLLSYVSASQTPTSIIGQQLTFNTGSVNYGINQSGITINVFTLPGAVIGDSLCIDLEVNPITGDVNPADNFVTVCLPVRNSCDPNEKYETLAGAASALISPGIELNYNVMFQNVGNDDAYDIYILDTLDANLDLSSFRLTSYSHVPTVRIINNNIIKFEFKNINLPAASVNEPLSQGFVSYSIDVPAGLAHGTVINNTAHIYFDFNEAIVTNTVSHIIDLSSGLDHNLQMETIALFPNPAVDYFQVKLDESITYILSIYDATGKLIMKKEMKGEQLISTKEWNKGIYLVNITSDNQSISGKLVVR